MNSCYNNTLAKASDLDIKSKSSTKEEPSENSVDPPNDADLKSNSQPLVKGQTSSSYRSEMLLKSDSCPQDLKPFEDLAMKIEDEDINEVKRKKAVDIKRPIKAKRNKDVKKKKSNELGDINASREVKDSIKRRVSIERNENVKKNKRNRGRGASRNVKNEDVKKKAKRDRDGDIGAFRKVKDEDAKKKAKRHRNGAIGAFRKVKDKDAKKKVKNDVETFSSDDEERMSEIDSCDEYSYESESDENESESDVSGIAAEEQSISDGWTRISDVFMDCRPDLEPPLQRNYVGVNPAVGFSENMNVYECVNKFITRTVIKHIVACVNDRANAFLESNPQVKGTVYKVIWKDVNEGDIWTFLGLYFYMGICKYNSMCRYWGRNPYHPGVHFFNSSVMSRDRFLAIMKFLRFSKVNEVKKRVPSTRIQPLCNILTSICMKNVDAGEHFSIDESLVLWKGHLTFRQYIKTKRSRYGIKLFMLCNSDADWSGYNYNFCVYYGRDSSAQYILPVVDGANELTPSEKVVVHLSKSILGQGRHLFVDNWYASTRLANFLLTQKTMMTSTLLANRGVPRELKNEKLKRHEYSFIRKDNVLLVKWEDHKSVYVLTSKYAADTIEKDKTSWGGKRVSCIKPYHVEMYNKYMGGVDRADQLMEPYEPCRKSLAWFKKLGLHLLMRMLLNSFLVYKNTVNKKMALVDFLLKFVEQSLEKHNSGAIATREKYLRNNPRSGRKLKLEPVVHALTSLDPCPGSNNKFPKKRCRVCYPKIDKKTRKCCTGCPEIPGLCSTLHFNIWHNRAQPSK